LIRHPFSQLEDFCSCKKQLKYTVFVKFNSSGKIQVDSNEITIALKFKPERGKANREMIEKLAEYFRISKDRIYILFQDYLKQKVN
jgi:uncharacterized protein